MKRIVFSLCYHFRTLKMENIVQLANILYNRRKHSSTGLPPYVCHNSAWAASLLAKLNGVNYTYQQIQSMGFLARSKPRDILNIGSKVKIRLLKNIFNKFKPLEHPMWSETVHTITRIDSSSYPYLYSVTDSRKKYYSFQLLKINDYYPLDKEKREKILVNNYSRPESNYLRSGITKEGDVLYNILKDNKILNVSKEDLKEFKKSFGENSLAYSSFFKDDIHRSFIV